MLIMLMCYKGQMKLEMTLSALFSPKWKLIGQSAWS